MSKRFVKYFRWILLGFFLTMITVEAYLHQIKGGGEAPSIHALCPYGGLETFYSLIFTGTFLQKIFSGTMILLAITLVLALVFKRSFCGLICPFGALQEFFGLIGKKVFHKRLTIPKSIDKPLRYIKYIILVLTLYFAWKTSGLWVDSYDPWAAYGHISSGFTNLAAEYLVGTIVMVIILIGSMLYDRFFCKYLCPMGAVYGILSKISPSKIVRNKDKCINCGLCSRSCPMNIDVANAEKVNSAECISCQSCVLSCPKKDALEYKTGKNTLQTLTIVILVVGLFFSGVFISKSTGIFQVLPQKITEGSKLNAEDIKGYMTIKEVSTGINMELKNVYEKLGIPNSVSEDTKLKDVQNYVPGFEVEAAREKLKK